VFVECKIKVANRIIMGVSLFADSLMYLIEEMNVNSKFEIYIDEFRFFTFFIWSSFMRMKVASLSVLE